MVLSSCRCLSHDDVLGIEVGALLCSALLSAIVLGTRQARVLERLAPSTFSRPLFVVLEAAANEEIEAAVEVEVGDDGGVRHDGTRELDHRSRLPSSSVHQYSSGTRAGAARRTGAPFPNRSPFTSVLVVEEEKLLLVTLKMLGLKVLKLRPLLMQLEFKLMETLGMTAPGSRSSLSGPSYPPPSPPSLIF